MATRIFARVETTPTNVVADVKAAILTSDAWSNPAGQRVVATTTRGADMVVDLAESAATAQGMTLGVYRTSGLADKVVRYLFWRGSAGATSDPIHAYVSAGKEHLLISIAAPYTGEANATAIREVFFMGDLAPYFSTDSQAAVVMYGATASSNPAQYYTAHVSRNAANTTSWVPAYLGAVCYHGLNSVFNLPLPAAADGDVYLWSYVVVENTAGLRGRLAEFFFVGWTENALTGLGHLNKLTIDSHTYLVIQPVHGGSRTSAFGKGLSTEVNTLVAVPYS